MRKGTRIPYIVHPLEAAVIVGSVTEDEELIAAAILHDVLEDTDASEEEVRSRFGDRVADLVVKETDDKSRSWMERKSEKLRRVREGSRDLKAISAPWPGITSPWEKPCGTVSTTSARRPRAGITGAWRSA